MDAVIKFRESELQLERDREGEIDPKRASEELQQRKKTTSFPAAAVCADGPTGRRTACPLEGDNGGSP